MESANLHDHRHNQQQQQLQDQLLIIQSSSLPTTPSSSSSCYGLPTTTPSVSWSSNNFLNSANYNPNTNGAMLNSRDPNINATSMNIQDLGFHWAIKDELSSDSNYPKFTEMINTSPSSSIEDLHLHNINDQRNLNDMSEKLFLRTFSSGCQINGLHLPPPDNFYSNINPQNCSSSSAPSRGTFSQIFPSINISNFGQSSSSISSSLGMNLDLFNSPRFSSHDQVLAGLSYNGVDHLQQLSHSRPSTSPRKLKTSTFSTTTTNGATEAKRRSSFMEPTKAPQAAPKKSRVDSRATCPPFKVRKEKLGDRIAALQQLVAPFGKTDTASVLMEAIGYIKFLQNQVETLSVPYMKSSRNKTSRTMQGVSTEHDGHGHEQGKADLRSRGLCLVPMSCLSYVTDGGGGVWAPPDFSGGS